MRSLITIIFIFLTLVSPAFAQTSSASNTPLVNNVSSPTIDKRLSLLENQVDLSKKIDTFINLLALLGGIILTVFGIFGGAIIWNGILWRQEAKKDLEDIEATRNNSIKLMAEIVDRNEQSKKVIEGFKERLALSLIKEMPKGNLKKDTEATLEQLKAIDDIFREDRSYKWIEPTGKTIIFDGLYDLFKHVFNLEKQLRKSEAKNG